MQGSSREIFSELDTPPNQHWHAGNDQSLDEALAQKIASSMVAPPST